MLSVQDYLTGLYRAVLRADAAVAKLCLGHLWKTLKNTDYIKWKLLLLCCSSSYHNLDEAYAILNSDKLTGKTALELDYNLCISQKARDAFALAWFVKKGGTIVPYEVAYFRESMFEPPIVGGLPFIGKDPVLSHDVILYKAALYLLMNRIRGEVHFVETPAVEAAKILPSWVTTKLEDIDIGDNTVNEAYFNLFISEYTYNVEIIEPTILRLKTTDNLLWTQYMATICNRANMSLEELCKLT